MAEKVDLSIVILNYNTRDLLQECLFSVNKAEGNSFRREVIVVDNNSTDNSAAMVKKEFPQVKLVENKKNLGFSAGNNIGIKKAIGKYILFLNPDTIVSPETFSVMLRFMEGDSQVGAATCRVELADGQLDEASHRGFPTPWRALCHFSGIEKLFPKSRFFAGYTLGSLAIDKIHEIDSGTGAFLLVRRKAGEEVGWWDEGYYWYGEDLDFCYQLKSRGWKVVFNPETKILHYKGVSSGIKKHSAEISTATEETRKRAARASTQAMRIFYRKNYRRRYPWVLTFLVLAGIGILEKIRLIRVGSFN